MIHVDIVPAGYRHICIFTLALDRQDIITDVRTFDATCKMCLHFPTRRKVLVEVKIVCVIGRPRPEFGQAFAPQPHGAHVGIRCARKVHF